MDRVEMKEVYLVNVKYTEELDWGDEDDVNYFKQFDTYDEAKKFSIDKREELLNYKDTSGGRSTKFIKKKTVFVSEPFRDVVHITNDIAEESLDSIISSMKYYASNPPMKVHDYKARYINIKSALDKKKELEKVLYLIIVRQVDIYHLIKCKTPEEYNRIWHSSTYCLTQEEFDLIKQNIDSFNKEGN